MSGWRENTGRQPVKADTPVLVKLKGFSGSSGKAIEAGKMRWAFSAVELGDIAEWRRA